MIPALLALAASAFPLGGLPPQTIGAGTCALFLWRADMAPGERAPLLLVATPDPPRARILLLGWTVDLPRTAHGDLPAAEGAAAHRTARYEANGVAVALDLALAPDPGDTRATRVPAGTLTLERHDGKDAGEGAVVPVAGMIGCEGN